MQSGNLFADAAAPQEGGVSIRSSATGTCALRALEGGMWLAVHRYPEVEPALQSS